jgi:hypothetical protein
MMTIETNFITFLPKALTWAKNISGCDGVGQSNIGGKPYQQVDHVEMKIISH